MFWGLIMEPQKRYSQVVKRPFHISMAALDHSSSDGLPAQVMVGYETRTYLLCTLQTPDRLQCPVDLTFEEGTTISFATNGKSHVHLTGYLLRDGDEDVEEMENKEEFEVTAQKKKRQNDTTGKQPSKKKAKKTEEVVEEEEDEEDDSDFSVDLDQLKAMDNKEDSLSEEGSESEDNSAEEEESDDEDEEEEIEKVVSSSKNQTKKNKVTRDIMKERTEEKTLPKSTPEKKKENGSIEEKKNGKQNQPLGQKVLPSGVIIEDLKEGDGTVASNGKFLYVFYQGFLKGKKKPFDVCVKTPGFGFRLGKGEVIKGWDIGLEGMKVGGKRRITIPPQLAYGTKGSLPAIPRNSTLVFEVNLRKIK